jgi:hypothetical protein
MTLICDLDLPVVLSKSNKLYLEYTRMNTKNRSDVHNLK